MLHRITVKISSKKKKKKKTVKNVGLKLLLLGCKSIISNNFNLTIVDDNG